MPPPLAIALLDRLYMSPFTVDASSGGKNTKVFLSKTGAFVSDGIDTVVQETEVTIRYRTWTLSLGKDVAVTADGAQYTVRSDLPHLDDLERIAKLVPA